MAIPFATAATSSCGPSGAVRARLRSRGGHCKEGDSQHYVRFVSAVVRGPGRPTTRELEAIRADLVTQATGANVTLHHDHAVAIVNELLELR